MIQVHDLRFTYPAGTTAAVDGVNFEIDKGEIFGFLGPSGAGKSTTQKIIIGLLRGYKGRVQVMGKSVADWGRDYYEHIGVGFETANHYLKLTGRENLSHFASLYSGPTESVDDLLEMVGLRDAADQPVGEYSKGMRMRLNFVRAFAHRPDLIFYDEPTAGLDPVNARKVKDIILAQQKAGKTIFLTTHDMNVADELCDRVAFIIDGRIPLIDAPGNLKQQYGERQVVVRYGQNGREETRQFALDGLGDNQPFIQLLRDEYVQTIHTKEATLENIFIDVTGRELV